MDQLQKQNLLDYIKSDNYLNLKLRRAVERSIGHHLSPNLQGFYYNGFYKQPFVIGQSNEQISLLDRGILSGHLFLAFDKFTVDQGEIRNDFIKFQQWIYNSMNLSMDTPNPGYFEGISKDGITYSGSWESDNKQGRLSEGHFSLVRMDVNK